jgi:hypothetical protein
MFANGADEPLHTRIPDLVTHSVVWYGPWADERVWNAAHPVCRVIDAIEARFAFTGAWLECWNVTSENQYARRRIRLDLDHAGFEVEERPDEIVAIRQLSERARWPRPSGIPFPRHQVLILGALDGDVGLRCPDETRTLTRSIWAENMVMEPNVIQYLFRNRCHAVTIGRSASESPGVSIIGPIGLDPATLMRSTDVLAIHHGKDAALAWARLVFH